MIHATDDLREFDAYLRGRFHLNELYGHALSIAAPDGEAARARFEEAVALDPRFAQAHAALGTDDTELRHLGLVRNWRHLELHSFEP